MHADKLSEMYSLNTMLLNTMLCRTYVVHCFTCYNAQGS